MQILAGGFQEQESPLPFWQADKIGAVVHQGCWNGLDVIAFRQFFPSGAVNVDFLIAEGHLLA